MLGFDLNIISHKGKNDLLCKSFSSDEIQESIKKLQNKKNIENY